MSAAFDFAKYEKEPEKEKSGAFDFAKYELPPKPQEPATISGAAKAFGAGAGGGAGGVVGDLANMGLLGLIGNLLPKSGVKSTPELTESLNPQGPQNALERILEKSGEFGGQEALVGTAAGGPIGAGLGLAHGAVSGALYGAAKELGANDTVALLSALATLSPIAAQRLIGKLSASKKTKDALKSVIARESEAPPAPPPGSAPPEAPPVPAREVQGIGPEKVIPRTEGAFEEKEKILAKLAEPATPEKLGIEARVAETRGSAAPTLQGRVTETPELGQIVSREAFQTEAQAGRDIAKEVRAERDAEKEIVREKYKKADEVTRNHEDIYPELASENERRISRLEELQKRSAAEEAVYQDALALRAMIGMPDSLIGANARRIMKQADSFSSKINYEAPYAGAKGEIKDMVHQMNQAVIASLNRAGLDAAAVIDADKTFAKFANRFMGDEIAPFLYKKILNPEELSRAAINNPGNYRAVKEAIGSRDRPIVNKIDREVTHKVMDKYAKNPEAVNSKEYIRDLRNLGERVGKEKIADIDHFLRQRQLDHEKRLRGVLKVQETQLSRENIPGKGPPLKVSDKISPKTVAETPEQLDKLFKSKSEIRKLKRSMKERGLEKEFERLAEDKVRDIFREGVYGDKKLTGQDITRIIDSKHEILEELMGKQALAELYNIGKIAGKEELTAQTIEKLLKKGAKLGLTMLGLGKISKFLFL